MKRLVLSALVALTTLVANAEDDIATYYMPRTQIKFAVLVERTDYKPGRFANYSEKYMREAVRNKPEQTYRIISITPYLDAVADTLKHHDVVVDKKHTVFSLSLYRQHILVGVNAEGDAPEEHKPFVSAPKPAAVNPSDYMSQDILMAGSTAKMAELTAQEIYDIRDSRSQLNRGEADYMPKDGQQLRIMLDNLKQQEQALMQTFTGVTTCDTTELTITYTPEGIASGKGGKEKKGRKGEADDEAVSDSDLIGGRQLLFRFSRKLGMLDADDLAGTPYYIYVDDLHTYRHVDQYKASGKDADKAVVYVNVPGKINVCVTEGDATLASFEAYMAQYGHEEALSADLFGKKMLTKVKLDAFTGSMVSIESEPLE